MKCCELCVVYVSVVSEDDELSAIEEPSDTDVHFSEETNHRLYGRQQISFTVCHHIVSAIACIVLEIRYIWVRNHSYFLVLCKYSKSLIKSNS